MVVGRKCCACAGLFVRDEHVRVVLVDEHVEVGGGESGMIRGWVMESSWPLPLPMCLERLLPPLQLLPPPPTTTLVPFSKLFFRCCAWSRCLMCRSALERQVDSSIQSGLLWFEDEEDAVDVEPWEEEAAAFPGCDEEDKADGEAVAAAVTPPPFIFVEDEDIDEDEESPEEEEAQREFRGCRALKREQKPKI